MARQPVARLILLLTSFALLAQQPVLKQAGVCSRCHVAQVLEWSASKHPSANTACQNCHGPSREHVANERNQIKPDRLPQGEAVAALCATCHAAGCPKTSQKSRCQRCHHAHALSNPADNRLQPTESAEEKTFAQFRQHMDDGERFAASRQWSAARDSFSAAVKLRPADRRAAARLRMAERRLNPAMPGFEIVGSEFDAESGLPLRIRAAGLGFEMVLIPAGDFDMGSDALPASKPVHTVHVDAFYLATHEMTQQLWAALGEPDNSVNKGGSLPVHNVSWQDAQSALRKLNASMPSAEFRLPTEAEWEYAAGAPVAGGAWYRENSAVDSKAGFRESDSYAPRPVGGKAPNARGLFDMQGNVAEWTSSPLLPYPFQAAEGGGMKVVRGGSYADSIESLNPALRHGERPTRRLPWNGLRLAR